MSTHAMEEEVFTGKMDFALWRKMLKFALPHRAKILAVMALGAAVSAFDMGLPFMTGRIVDAVTTHGASTPLRNYLAQYALLIAGFSACIFAFIAVAGRITVSISYDIRQTCFDKLQRLPFSYYDRKAVGWLMARMTSDCSNLSRVMAWSMLDLAWGSCALLGTVVLMLWLAWKLALVVITVAPALIIVSRYFQVRLLKTSRELRKANSQTTAAFNEGIVGVRTTKSMVREERNAEEFSRLTQSMYGHAVRNAIYASMFWPLMLSVCGIGTALALRFGGLGVVHGQLTLGALATFLQIVFFIQFPVQELTNSITQIQGAQASAERIQGLLDADVEIEDSPAVVERIRNHAAGARDAHMAIDGMDARVHSIEFRNVNFSYKGGQAVLSDFNLTMRAGESIALVGPTGGGKTTIVGLACRFYEPTSGQILINGIDYRERPLQWLQSNLGMVLQQPHLFSGTVKENIRYGRLAATDEEIIQAAKLTEAHEFIELLKDKYGATVGEGGNQLSTGQKQLISLARAIIADPQIFVMDEATSSVDTQTERAIQSAIDRILRNRISFVIAHRLSTIKSASRILVIEGGRIIEDGTHHSLIRRRGHYCDLYTNQFTREREEAVLGG
ncbi:MAG TPA: ABC transporter ATP-binding protein [Tepidisphaeraceae bacterium]|jgi:ATP-binding cassette subfamily B protein|nr:ABC transporter ATP-binding protein [Tepidisphaeraceae bacterium]